MTRFPFGLPHLIACAATGAALYACDARAGDGRCDAARAWPGAAVFEGRAALSSPPDLIVLAPGPNAALRWCYWNSPTSAGDSGAIDVGGETVPFTVQITGGPEMLSFDLPGAIATDADGVPLSMIEVPDDQERTGLLFRGMM